MSTETAGCLLIVGAPITSRGGTVRRLRLWLTNLPGSVKARFLYWSDEPESALRLVSRSAASASIRRKRALARCGRVLIAPAVIMLYKEMVVTRPAAVLSFFPWTSFAAGIASRMVRHTIGLSVLHGIHLAGDPIPPEHQGRMSGRVYRWLFQRSLTTADAVFVLSGGMQSQLRREYHVPATLRIVTLPISIETSRTDVQPTQSDRHFTFGIVARLVAAKGIDLVLSAMARIAPEVHPRLIIFGEGPQRDVLAAQIEELNLRNQVSLSGWIDDPLEAFRQMDCAILASYSEGTPRSILEAASVGVPTIATRVGGVPDMIRHDENGWLVPPGDVESLSAAMLRVAENPSLARAAGRSARALVEANANPQAEMLNLLSHLGVAG